MPSDVYFENSRTVPLKVLDGDGYISINEVMLRKGTLWVSLEAAVSMEPDAEHTIAIHRDNEKSTIALTARGLEAVSDSTDEPAGTPYVNVHVDNTNRD